MSVRSSLLQLVATPDRAWIILLAGTLLLAREFTRPGRVLPGVAGGAAIVLALHALVTGGYRLNPTGAALVGVALCVLLLQARRFPALRWQIMAFSAVLAATGARWLVQPPWQISLLIALATAPVVAVLSFLMNAAARAYANKVS